MVRTTKKSGKIKIRFRVSDGREVQLFYKSEIEAEVSEVEKLNIDGTPKKRANYDRDLVRRIEERKLLINSVYEAMQSEGQEINAQRLSDAIERELHPEKFEEEASSRELLKRFDKYIKEGLFGEGRRAGYRVTYGILYRFLQISENYPTDIKAEEVTPSFLLDLRNFMAEEYIYPAKKKWSHLYEDFNSYNLPTAPRTQNTIASKMKQLQAFFAQLEDADEIVKSPFRKMGRENRRAATREQFAQPFSLTLEELKAIEQAEVPKKLQSTKEAFIVMCALGCRISDFAKMDMSSLAISENGVPYVRYIPKKTLNHNNSLAEVSTPLIKTAFDIIIKNGFSFPIARYSTGENGFNKKIKELLKVCEIVREVKTWNDLEKKMERRPICEVASSKIGRKTNVTLLNRVQINTTIGGLHSEGSEAVKHYFDERIEDLFLLMCRAFQEKPYKVDKSFNCVEL